MTKKNNNYKPNINLFKPFNWVYNYQKPISSKPITQTKNNRDKMLKTVILDLGHGGLLNGVYTTGNKKMHVFPNGEVAYEGVINRQFGTIIGQMLEERCVNVEYTVHPEDPTDLSLRDRVKFTKRFKKNDAIFISIHCNAFNTRVYGTEIFTTVGQTKSDILASCIITSVNKACPELKMRFDWADGDADKESQFFVLRKTHLFAVLLECLFFDNWEDFQRTKDEDFVNRFCKSVVDGIIKFIGNN